MGLKIFLDDLRPTPIGWTRVYTTAECLDLLLTRQATHCSLDNDLGLHQPEGYTVLNALEQLVFSDPEFPIPVLTIHSSNAARRQDMERAIQSIHRIRQKQL